MDQNGTTLGEAERRYFDENAVYFESATLETKRIALRLFRQFFGSDDLAGISREVLLAFQVHRLKVKGCSPYTVNANLSNVKAFLRWCQQVNLIDPSKSFTIRRLPTYPPVHGDDCSPEDVRKLINCLLLCRKRRLADLVILCVNVGLRISEALRIRGDEVNLDDRLLEIKVQKNRKYSVLKLNALAFGVLKRLTHEHGSGLLFPGLHGRPLTRHYVRLQLKLFADGMGLKMSFQMLRRLFGTINAKHCTPSELCAMMRHSSPVVGERFYIRHKTKSLPTATRIG